MSESNVDQEFVLSRSQRRRDAQAVLELAREIVALSPGKFDALDLPEHLRDALAKARRIRQHVARKRETQHAAKLMREMDCAPIREALHQSGAAQREEAARQHRCEDWRDALLDTQRDAMTVLCGKRPGIDAGHLRQLVRTALKEQAHEKPPAAARQLFRALRELDLQEALPPVV